MVTVASSVTHLTSVPVPAGDGGLLITHHTMILVTIAVLMADTTPLTSTDTVTAVGEHTQLMMTQNKYSIVSSTCCCC